LVLTQVKTKGDAKIDAFGITIETDRKTFMRFAHDAEYKGEKIEKLKNDSVLKVFEKSEKWMGVKDLSDMGFGKETTIRAQLKHLERNYFVQSKLRKDAMAQGLPLHSKDGSHNEKLYFRFNDDGAAGPAPPDLGI
jgi:hypothetical protein